MKIKKHRQTRFVYPKALITGLLRCPTCHIPWHQISKCGISSFQVIVAVFFGDIIGRFGLLSDGFYIFFFLGNPYPAIVSQGFRHQRQFGLIGAGDRNTGWMNLGITWVGHIRPAIYSPPRSGDVTPHRVGGEVKHIAIASRCQYHAVCGVSFDIPCDEVADDDSPGFAIHDDDIENLVPREELDLSGRHLS